MEAAIPRCDLRARRPAQARHLAARATGRVSTAREPGSLGHHSWRRPAAGRAGSHLRADEDRTRGRGCPRYLLKALTVRDQVVYSTPRRRPERPPARNAERSRPGGAASADRRPTPGDGRPRRGRRGGRPPQWPAAVGAWRCPSRARCSAACWWRRSSGGAGGRPGPLGASGASPRWPAHWLSRTARAAGWLIVWQRDVWVVDIARGTRERLTKSSPTGTIGQGCTLHGDQFALGQLVYAPGAVTGIGSLALLPGGGGQPRVVFSEGTASTWFDEPAWTPDGRALVYGYQRFPSLAGRAVRATHRAC